MTSASPRSGGPPADGLGDAAARGVAVQGLSFAVGKIFVFATTLVLARLLVPEEFGLVTIALIPITYLELVSDLGVNHAVIYFPRTQRRLDAAMVLNVAVAALLTGGLVLAAPAIASFFGQPSVTAMLRVLAFGLVLHALGQVPDAVLRQELRFSARFRIEAVRAVAQSVTSVALAAAGLGGWAIAIGYLAGYGAWAIAGWRSVDYRPRWRLRDVRAASYRPMIRYGIPSAANAFLLALVYDLDYIFVGRALGAVELGRYTMAFRIPQALIVTAFYALSTVAFPVLVRIGQDRPRMAAAYVGWMRIQLLYGLVSGITLALLAPNLVPLVLGDDWIPIVPALQALALYASLRSLSSGAFDLYKAVGRPTLALGLSVVRLGAVVPMLFLTVDDGIDAVAWGQVVVAGVLVCIMQAVACRVLGLRAVAFARAMISPIAVALVVAGAIIGTRAAIPGSGFGSTTLVLAVAVAVGAIGVRVLAPDLARQLRRFLATAFDVIRPTRRARSVVAPGSET